MGYSSPYLIQSRTVKLHVCMQISPIVWCICNPRNFRGARKISFSTQSVANRSLASRTSDRQQPTNCSIRGVKCSARKLMVVTSNKLSTAFTNWQLSNGVQIYMDKYLLEMHFISGFNSWSYFIVFSVYSQYRFGNRVWKAFATTSFVYDQSVEVILQIDGTP